MMASGNCSQDAASHTEQTEVVRQILTEKGQPLSWETLGKLYKERDPSFNYQSVQDDLCRTSGILCSRDFIALDTPRNVALLKLELAVVVNEKLNKGKFSKASHYFRIAASEEEKDELGHNEDSLTKSMLDFQDIFVVTSLSDQGSNHKKIVLKPGIADQHKSFFRFENDTKASALHKLKYFLFLCHGSTNVRSAFEYSRCFLTKAEKVHFSRNMTDDFVKALKLQCPSINVNERVVALSLSPKVQIQKNPNDGNGLNQKKSLDVFDEDDVSLFKAILKDGPLSWKCFPSELESRKPETYGIDIREVFCQSPPNGFLNSPDFISIYNDVKCSALTKLHFILAVNNKLGNGHLGKISYHFNVLGSEQERDMFGRNSNELSQSLLNHSNIFRMSSEGGNLRSVKCGPLAIPFNSFFQFEGKSKESFCHKLKYFLNLCSGTCTVFAAYEFSRNLLRRDEKQLFMSNQESFIQFVSSLRKFFKVTADKIQLLQSHLWRTQLKEASIFPGDMKIQSPGTVGKKDQGGPTSVTKKIQKQPSEALTEDFVKDILKSQGYPMSWTEFKKKFLSLDENPGNTVEEFMKQYSNKVAKSLCMSKDFVALNSPFHRNRLKLQLILENRSRANKPSKISLMELKEQFEEIASDHEIVETLHNCPSLQEFLWKFPKVFVIKKDFVTQGASALKFLSFFGKEKEGAKPSVMNKLNYFVNICGDYCDISYACKFLQTHLSRREELELVSSDDKVFDLIKASQGGKMDDDVGGHGNATSDNEVQIGNPTAAISDVNSGVSQVAKANSNGPPPPKESPTMQSKGSEQTVPMPLSLPDKGPTPSILPVQGALPSIPDSEREVPPTSEECTLSSSSSLKSISSDPTKTKTARKRSKKKKADAPVSMATETKVDVKVEVIGNENRLTMLISQMLEEVNPIISVMHSQDILVVLNWSRTGFLLPIPPIGGQVNHKYDARWTKLCDFLKNQKVVMVTFDCESVGKVLLERLDLKLGTVFDIKCGVQLLSFESPSNSPSYRNVTAICQRFALPGPGCIIPHIVGDLDLWDTHKNIQLNKDEVLLMIKDAASLIPTVYGWICYELHSRGALKELESLTKKKLDVMYTEAENESSLAADDSSTSTTTPTPSSYKSSTSLKASHSTGEMKMFPELPGQNTSLQYSLSQNSMIVNGGTEQMIPPGQSTSTLSPFSQNSMMLNENQVQWIPLQNDWFSEENDYIPVGSSVLEGSFHQKVYCLRKTEDGDVSPVPQEEANSYDSNLSGLTEELVKHFSEKNSESIIQLLTLLGDDILITLGEQLQGQSKNHVDQLSEIVLDVGRCAEARLHKTIKGEKPVVLVASSKVITSKALQEIEENDALTGFYDNQCGVEGCLHSLRGVRNRMKKLIGLTVRVALPLLGCADMMYDIALSGRSILIVGCPGVGKTTLLRELARCLSDTEKKKVVVIDTYNEIAGDSDTPHFSIGSARRLQVNNPEEQHQVISESANHSPEVVIIDQIELKSDVTAAKRLPRYGIQVIAGIKCDSVMNLITDETLSQIFQIRGSNMLDDLQSLDSAGALALSNNKCAFQALVEMKESDCWHIHDLNHTWSWTNISTGQAYSVQERTRIGLNHRQPGWEQQIILRETLINPQET
ncbi:uncharacterized protein [Apostichopus japonicus]|uniref:uncharacterized protein isoform X2 n=1 Tax=Stichopus japonicus TaxID=307972 RepID=UPI003AB277CB